MFRKITEKRLIKKFMKELKKQVLEINKIIYRYDKYTNTHFVEYDLTFEKEEKYKSIIGELICDILFEHEIYNFALGYCNTNY